MKGGGKANFGKLWQNITFFLSLPKKVFAKVCQKKCLPKFARICQSLPKNCFFGRWNKYIAKWMETIPVNINYTDNGPYLPNLHETVI